MACQPLHLQAGGSLWVAHLRVDGSCGLLNVPSSNTHACCPAARAIKQCYSSAVKQQTYRLTPEVLSRLLARR
jgi:hypothetical protein